MANVSSEFFFVPFRKPAEKIYCQLIVICTGRGGMPRVRSTRGVMPRVRRVQRVACQGLGVQGVECH